MGAVCSTTAHLKKGFVVIRRFVYSLIRFMRPANLKTKIFLDSGDPAETRAAFLALGFLDGQTTNPSLVAKNPETAGKKFSKDELISFYRKVVEEISSLIPKGSVSVEVYADALTSAEEMLKQARIFNKWISNAHVKFPTTTEGLKAAEIAVREGIKVNMTLVFSQQQAAAVYMATKGAKKGDVFISPFAGRLDDIGENGMDVISNIVKMYKTAPLCPDLSGHLSRGERKIMKNLLGMAMLKF